MTIPFKKLKDEWVKSPSFRAEYDRLKPEYALVLALLKGAITRWHDASGA